MIPSKKEFEKEVVRLQRQHEKFVSKKNKPLKKYYNGIYTRYKRPILTGAHTPLTWRYDFNYETNPYLMQRIGINAAFNSGAIYLDKRFLLCARVEG
ncbi:MAG: glycosidase, partial [Mariniphaga sp.]